MSKGYEEQIAALQGSLADDREHLRIALARVKHVVGEPLDVPRRIRERPTPWLFGAALVGLWLGARVNA